jgi:perosamine synthetase
VRSRIPVAGPSVGPREAQRVQEALAHGWYGEAGRTQERFEKKFADEVGTRHAVCVPSCTSAIHLSLAALGVGPGDEVIVPEITWIASAAPAVYLGATPIFADIDPETWCIDPSSVEALITPRTRAILGVDIYGGMCNWDALAAIARPRGIALIEDAAQAIGSRYRDHAAGSLGDTGVFSFHGTKTMTTGEGGMLVTNRDDVADRVRGLRDHGRYPGDAAFFNREIGFKYRMSDLQAGLGLAQLERLDELVGMKRALFHIYQELLSPAHGLTLNVEPAHTKNSYWMTTVVLDETYGMHKTDLMAVLASAGNDTRPFFYPLSSLPAFESYPSAAEARSRNRVSYDISPRAINLPSALCLDARDVERVCFALGELLGFTPRRLAA